MSKSSRSNENISLQTEGLQAQVEEAAGQIEQAKETLTGSFAGANQAEAEEPMQVAPSAEGAFIPVISPLEGGSEKDIEAMSAYKTLEARKKRKRRNRVIVGCVVAALALAGIGWWAFNTLGSPDASNEAMPAYGIDYAYVDTYENSVSASGAIKPAKQVVVTPEVEGIIQNIQVAEGAEVLKGDVLFTLKNDALDKAIQDAEQGVRSAENGVSSAQNSVNSAYNSLVSATNNYNTVFSTRYETQEIADAAGAEATELLNGAQNAYDSAVLALEDAQIAVTKAQEALEDARATADKRTVRAPESGAIVAMTAEEGASVGGVSGSASGSGSSAGSLITIADLSSLRVSVQVNEVDINSLKEGQKAEVSFSALPDVVLEATVDHIAAISSGAGEEYGGGGIVTYGVDLVIENPDSQVKPGMTARVRILTEQIENALIVPTAALLMEDETHATILADPNYAGEGEPEFEEVAVEVVAQDASLAVIKGNVAEGSAVQVFYGGMGEDESAWEVSVG